MKVIICVLSILLITSCFQLDDYKNDFFNNEKRIINSRDSYTFLQRSLEASNSEINLSFSSLNGSDTLYSNYFNKGEVIDFTLFQELVSGEIKIVLISPDDKVIPMYPGYNRFVAQSTGVFTIKVLAYNATGSIKLTSD